MSAPTPSGVGGAPRSCLSVRWRTMCRRGRGSGVRPTAKSLSGVAVMSQVLLFNISVPVNWAELGCNGGRNKSGGPLRRLGGALVCGRDLANSPPSSALEFVDSSPLL